MKCASVTLFKLSMIALTPVTLAACGIPMWSQDGPAVTVGNLQITGAPEDWSHHHVVFSNPGTEEESFRNGTHEKWIRIVNDPRYLIQQTKRHQAAQQPKTSSDAVGNSANPAGERHEDRDVSGVVSEEPVSRESNLKKPGIKKDWNEALYKAGTATAPSNVAYPAKWSFNSGTASCASDFVIYPTGTTGSSTQASIIAYFNMYTSGCSGTTPQVNWAYNTGANVTLSPVFSFYGNQVAFIQSSTSSIASLVLLKFSANGSAFTGTTSNTSKNVTVTSCPAVLANEPVFGPGIPSGDTIASCSGTTLVLNTAANATGTSSPLTYTNQFTGTLANGSTSVTSITTGTCTPATVGSPIYGTGIPVGDTVSACSGTTLTLAIAATASGATTISFSPATLAAPVTLTSQTTATAYQTCVAPCMYSVALNGNPNDTQSNPYLDYLTDSLYVGDSVGKLHKFSPVFNGALAEVTTSWPVQLNDGSADTNQAASPVYDVDSGYVFVGTTSITTSTGGVLYSVGTGNQSTTSGSIHGYSAELDELYGILDAPLVDSTAGKVYVFSGENTSGNNAVYQFATNFVTGATPSVATLGAGGTGTTTFQFAGTFDNTYYTSSSGSSPSGNLYVCGTAASAPIYQVAIVNNAFSTVTTGPTISGSSYYGRCSPVTEFYNSSIPVVATGSATIIGTPSAMAGVTVTVGSQVYTFVTSIGTTANQVLLYTSSGTASHNQERTAQNLYAAINAISSDCYQSPCFGSSTTANTKATASYTTASAEVDLTATAGGSSGDFTLSTSNTSDVTISSGGGQNGSNGADYLFVSVFGGSESGCTNGSTDGCIMSFSITTPSSFSSSSTPLGTQNLSAVEYGSPTGGIIIDNGVATPAGTSQIYFVTQSTAGTTPCTGICAVQASQSAP